MSKKLVGLFGALVVVALFGSALMTLINAMLTETSAPAVAVEQPTTRFITVAGTGLLQEESGRFFVRGSCQFEVALGTIDASTQLFGKVYADLSDQKTLREHYLNKRVTVIAAVEAAVDDKEVLRAVRTASLTIFRHSDGLPER